MPSDEQLRAGLAAIANEWVALAILWHVMIAVAVVASIVGWRPDHRSMLRMLGVSLASVSVLAWTYRNPFNGLAFASLAVAMWALSKREAHDAVRRTSRLAWGAGVAMIAFAWFYPHFLGTPLLYLVAAPVGLIPCPTLALVIGAVLLGGAGFHRSTRWILVGAATFYALFGVVALGVFVDLGLLAGAAMLAIDILVDEPIDYSSAR
jgi:hypothetical protein